jgi:hypothetical protein
VGNIKNVVPESVSDLVWVSGDGSKKRANVSNEEGKKNYRKKLGTRCK